MGSEKLVIITGTPGTGKTTIAAKLASILPANHIDLPFFVEKEGLWLGRDEKRGVKIVDLPKVRRRLRTLAKRSPLKLVVSSHIPDVAFRGDVDVAIVLRLHPCELKRRLEALNWPFPKVRENVIAEVLAVCLKDALSYYGEEAVFEVDVTGLSVEEAAIHLAELLKSRSGARGVDWLSRAIEDEELAKLLALL
ncbi:MAG: AAA family ATPase [Candidatus Nezhaarchaeota archaeon]|nr:AAA family ATPase [Candidatus Nezhaarchaeota archaeon]